MTKTNEMPGVIWVYRGKYQLGVSKWPSDPLTGGARFPREKYHHTAALIERLEGMEKPFGYKPCEGVEWTFARISGYNAALQDVIDILKGERE